MSNVDNQVVDMKFNNAEFEQKAGTTLGTLGRLKEALGFKGATQGLADVQRTMNRFDGGGMAGAVQGVSKRFIAMSAVAVAAISRITNAAITAGINIGKGLTVAPILGGLKEYETNLNSIQSILANTESKGETLKSVQDALNQLNTYSDKTIYNFSQMAGNIKQFTTAGIGLQTSVDSIKGLSNVAALFGVDATDAARGMYQLSQAMGTGVVRLMDWRSLENSGLAGEAFRESLLETARVHGVQVDKMIKDTGSFRDSLSKDWLTAQIMTETLKKFTGDLSDEQLKNQGYTEKQIEAIQKLAKSANDSATKVKTLSQLMDTLKEAAGSGWAKTWSLLFGNLKEARKLFTGASDTLGGFIQNSANMRNKVLGHWKDLGGRQAIIDGISNAFNALIRVIRPIKRAFRDLFPRQTGKDLAAISKGFRDFTESLKIGEETSHNLRRTFRGVFAIFDIGMQVVSGIFDVFQRLFGAISDGSGGFLDLTGDIGDFLYNLSQTLRKTGAITNFFEKLGNILAVPLLLLRLVGKALGQLFQGLDAIDLGSISSTIKGFADNLEPVEKVARFAAKAWDVLIGVLRKVGEFLKPFADSVVSVFDGLGQGLAKSLQNGNFNAVLQVLNTALLGGVLLLVRKFFKKLLDIDLGGGVVSGLANLFGEMGDTLEAFQNQLKSKTLLTIAFAVGVLTLSIIALSGINKEELGRALAAIGGLMGALLSFFTGITLISVGKGFLKIPTIAAGMVGISTALLVMAGALRIFGTMKPEELARGLAAVVTLLASFVAVVGPLSKNAAGMVTAGAGIVAIAVAMNILAGAVKLFATMSWTELAKGLGAVAVLLGVIAGAMKLMDFTTMKTQGLAIIAVAIALNILALAVKQFATMNLKELGKGLGAVAASLGIIAGAFHLMPADMAVKSAALLVVSGALIVLAQALKMMGNLKKVGQSLVVMGISLLMLALGLKAMDGSVSGAAALAVASAALIGIAEALRLVGSMSVEEIAKALLGIAGAFTILGIAGYLLAPLTPVLLGLSAAMLAIGGALALAGVGMLAFGVGFAIFVAAATAGVAVLTAITELFPLLMQNFALGIVAFITTLSKNSAEMFAGLAVLVDRLVTFLVDSVPKLADAGLQMILGLLGKIEENLDKFIEIGVKIFEKLLGGLGKAMPDLIDGGFKLLLAFMNALTTKIALNDEEFGRAGARLAIAIIKGFVTGIWAGLDEVTKALKEMSESAARNALADFNPVNWGQTLGQSIGEGIAGGVSDRPIKPRVDTSAMDDAGKVIDDWSTNNLNLSPTITPVLDLKGLSSQSSKFEKLINPSASLELAAPIGTEGSPLTASPSTSTDDIMAAMRPIEFTQYNNSPKALDPIEIFRQTRNQLSLYTEEVISR